MNALTTNSHKQYAVITGNYWAFTITDGALRMLIVLYFHQLGYSPFTVASLFLFYEMFGIVTNLFGGWLGARFGLNKTMNIGLALQIVALAMLLVPTEWLTVLWVMLAQAMSGIAKDLNKMSAKSGIKLLVKDEEGKLYRWVALLTGSKNTLKGVGYFIGAGLLQWIAFKGTVISLLILLVIAWSISLVLLKKELGKTTYKPKFSEVFSKSNAVNILSAARCFLFGSRDVWFVVALPVFLYEQGWTFTSVGTVMALWIIVYGFIQSSVPSIPVQWLKKPDGFSALIAVSVLAVIPIVLFLLTEVTLSATLIVVGIFIFGAVFAINSAIHSYLIVAYAKEEGVSLDVGFYYMANASGRLIGTVLSGALYQWGGIGSCLMVSALFLIITAIISVFLPSQHQIYSAK